jgi:hypothetical protein
MTISQSHEKTVIIVDREKVASTQDAARTDAGQH